MDLSVLVLSVEATRREARSALPHAKVRLPRTRWRRTRAAVRRLAGPEARAER